MKMYEVEVSLVNGEIHVSQQLGLDEPQTIILSTDQAEFVAKWIVDAAAQPGDAQLG